ncbi:bola protein [Entophlyctis helioformis]|nr:bola protein [Entophlyctis helioformis]
MTQTGPIAQAIEVKITNALQPTKLEIHDDSSKHKGHAGMKGLNPSETHFRLVIVSDAFEAKSLVQRHKFVYEILEDELKGGLHALSLTTKTPQEFAKAS